jgi:double-stranded uracil-DNA glycosylase
MRPTKPFRPTKEQLASARDKVVPDLIAPGLKVLFCGINPGLYSGATEHHFARPGNRFWPALHLGGFTDRVLSPFEEAELLARGYGITNFVQRTTATAAELAAEEYVAGAQRLRKKVLKYQPRVLAVLGIGAYRTGFAREAARIGLQEDTIGHTRIWILPNPSGLNAHYSLQGIGALFAELKAFADQETPA